MTKQLLGIDYGAKRVGLALSDEGQTIAVPFSVTPNDRTLFREIKSMVDTRGIKEIVLGESKDFKGNDNPIMKAVRDFQVELERDLKVKVFFEPEFMTSQQARRAFGTSGEESGVSGVRGFVDASAAALILQSFLDRRKSRKKKKA